MLNGLTIRQVNKDKIKAYNSVDKYLSYAHSTLFEIESGSEKYYVAASFVQIFENDLQFNETSLGVIYKGRDKEIAGSR